jgi:hypothetical protein
VIITVTQAKDGPACTMPSQPCGGPVALASAYNSAGKDVWDSHASKNIPGTQGTCLPVPLTNMTWLAHYSDIQKFGWNQDECTQGFGPPGHANPHCPGRQVPAGRYRIVGVFDWSDWRVLDHGPSASATITISG